MTSVNSNGQVEILLRPRRLKQGHEDAVYHSVTHAGMQVLNYENHILVKSKKPIHSVHYEMKAVKQRKAGVQPQTPSVVLLKEQQGWFYHILHIKGMSTDKSGCAYKLYFNDDLGISFGHTPFVTLKSTHSIDDKPQGFLWANCMKRRKKK